MIKNSHLLVFSLIPSVLLLTGCNDEEIQKTIAKFSGKSEPATVDASNAESIAVAATSGAKQAIKNEKRGNSPFGFSYTEQSTASAEVVEQLNHIINISGTNNSAPVGATYTTQQVIDADPYDDSTSCGGSVSAPDNFDIEAEYPFEDFNGNITFNDVCIIEEGIRFTIDGTIKVLSDSSGGYVMTFIDLTYTEDGQVYTLNETLTCDIYDYCETTDTTEDFVSNDGSVDRVADISVSGDENNGYTVQTTFSDDRFGSLSISSLQPIKFDCPNGNPSTGKLKATDSSDSSVTIEYLSCSSYEGSYIVSGNSGSFSGNW